VLTEPFTGMSLQERDGIETEIESTVLECLPDIESNPLLMLAAAKLLYFINRGHLDLAEEIAGRAFAPTQDFTAALPILGQLKYARGRYDEAVKLFDQGIAMAPSGSEFHWHMRVLKCLALVAGGHSGASAAQATDIGNFSASSLREINLMLGWTTASPDKALPPEEEQALQELGAAGAAKALEYLYFTSARHIITENGRANVMRSMIAHVSRLHGRQAIPDFILRGSGAAGSP
ncbi:MAG: tetratricopeptide repeat protein, partial [Shinella sp.]